MCTWANMNECLEVHSKILYNQVSWLEPHVPLFPSHEQLKKDNVTNKQICIFYLCNFYIESVSLRFSHGHNFFIDLSTTYPKPYMSYSASIVKGSRIAFVKIHFLLDITIDSSYSFLKEKMLFNYFLKFLFIVQCYFSVNPFVIAVLAKFIWH